MERDDTIKLLRECNAGIKMGVSSLDENLDKVSDTGLASLLKECKDKHEEIGNRTHSLLLEYNEEGKEPNPMAQVMSWFKTNMTLKDDMDSKIADVITDGCNMGVKFLHKYLNQYPKAEKKVRDIAKDLADIEEKLVIDIRPYL